MPTSDPNLTEPHDEAEELLPWYVTGQLDEADRVRVEAHLAACADCERQVALDRRLVREFRALTPEVESGWARLRARIESPAPARTRRPGAIEQFWALVSRPAVAGLAFAQLAFVVVSAGVLLSLSKPAYHTLGSAPVPASANVIVMFQSDAKVAEMDAVLRSASATVVEGPTESDAYLLHVPAQQREAALKRLQSSSTVQLAQPIDGVAS